MAAERPLAIFDPAVLKEAYEWPELVGCGIDVCDVGKIKSAIEDGIFIIENFADWEIVYCEQATNPDIRAKRYARRFAAKEAVSKALGLNGMGVNFLDIGILKDREGSPYIFLGGEVKGHAEVLGVKKIFISLTCGADVAAALCFASREALIKDATS